MNGKRITLTKAAIISVMAAVSTIIYYIFPEIPLVPGIEHLKMDFSDIPAIIACVVSGPVSGIIVEVIKNIFHLFRTTSVGIGELINVGIGSTIILSLSIFSKLFARVYKKEKLSPSVYYSAGAAAIVMTVFSGWLLNALLTPLYFAITGIPITAATVFAGVWGSTLLNVIKAALNLLPFYPVYYAVNKATCKFYH